MQTVFEHTAGRLTAFVTQTADRYSVGMRDDSTGKVLPYSCGGFQLEQAKERAIRWATRGGPMK